MNRFLGYLSNFSSSFLLAILLWPFLAAILTLPILIYQYRKYNKIVFRQAALIYIFMLYILALFSFALYPMPDSAVDFCQKYNLSPQLQPLNLLNDINSDGLKAILQVIMNLIFFLPLGGFVRILFRKKLSTAIAVSLSASLLIEVAQLTGVFGLYPCSYRLFDIDDILINLSGGVIGYLLALIIPVKELERAEKDDVVVNPGAIRYFVSFIIDEFIRNAIVILSVLAIYLLFNTDAANFGKDYIEPLSIIIYHALVPLFIRGWTLGGAAVRLNLDDKNRTRFKRIFYYILRSVYIITLFGYGGGLLSFILILATVITWRKWHILPYQAV